MDRSQAISEVESSSIVLRSAAEFGLSARCLLAADLVTPLSFSSLGIQGMEFSRHPEKEEIAYNGRSGFNGKVCVETPFDLQAGDVVFSKNSFLGIETCILEIVAIA
jgi:hypothetical protein